MTKQSAKPRFTFDLPDELRERLLAFAENKGVKAAHVLRDYIKHLPKQ